MALLGSLVLIVGVPVALVYFVGNPLPTTPPTRDWLTADVTPTLVIDVLAVLVWVVWVHFLVCFLTEWRAVRAGRMPGRVAFGGGSQVLARQLVAGLLLLAGGASIAQGATALAADAPDTVRTTVTATSVADFPAPMITPEQRAAVEAEAQDQTDRAGRGVKHYEVKPPRGRNHDTLWDISERLLGDPLRYKEIFELNKSRLQPDGARLTDADLIRPGWQLRLPADASGPGVRLTPAPATPVHDASDAAGTVSSTLEDSAVDSVAGPVQDVRTEDGGLAELLLGGGLVLAGVVRALTARRGPFGEPDEGAGALTEVAGAAARRARRQRAAQPGRDAPGPAPADARGALRLRERRPGRPAPGRPGGRAGAPVDGVRGRLGVEPARRRAGPPGRGRARAVPLPRRGRGVARVRPPRRPRDGTGPRHAGR